MIDDPSTLLTDGLTSQQIAERLSQTDEEISSEPEYHSHPFISNSNLKTLEQNPRTFYREKILGQGETKQTSYMKLGSMVDCLLLEPHKFDERYVEEPSGMNRPRSKKETAFCEAALNGQTSVEAYREIYSTSSKSEATIERKALEKAEKFESYFEFKRTVNVEGLTPYSPDEHSKAMKVFYDIQQHRKAQAILNPGRNRVQLREPQKIITYVLDGVFCRSMLDLVIVTNNEIVSIDLKTTSKPLSNFEYWYSRRRYYRQQAMYRQALRHEFEGTEHEGLPIVTYVIASFTQEPYGTIVRRIDEKLLDKGIQETSELLRHLRFHINQNLWSHRPDYYSKDRIQPIRLDESSLLPLNI
jgi:hypothetical protein